MATLSSPAETKKLAPCGATLTPLTIPRWALTLQTHLRLARSHTRTSPSQAPEINCTSDECGCDEHHTPSVWPSMAPIKGLANTFSSFTAFSALRYSRAFAKGWSSGAVFRGRMRRSDASSRVHACSDLARALNFMSPCALLGRNDLYRTLKRIWVLVRRPGDENKISFFLSLCFPPIASGQDARAWQASTKFQELP